MIRISNCVACDKTTTGSLEFCRTCYGRHKDDIKAKKPWVKSLKNDAQRERRRREREYDNTSLDMLVDNYSNRRRNFM